ncbi:hypothetical protein ACQP2P_05305 [Dactylosporangium sp. CA-139114]|uniref:hypothetical protein n=1 Tax=Dactylosporangium sp. CA-139114 TaxID=3239931 RepID=UPI003D9583F2
MSRRDVQVGAVGEVPGRTPATLRWAVRLLLVEGAGLAAVTLWLVYLDLTSDAASVPGAVSVTVYLALMTVCFAGVGFALHRRRRWARGPGIVVSMLQMPIGLTMLQTGQPWIGGPLFVLGLTGAVLLFAPSTRIALGVR